MPSINRQLLIKLKALDLMMIDYRKYIIIVKHNSIILI